MSEKQGYNGWSNYESWNLALWIGNEEGSYNYWRERTEEAYRDADKGEDRKHKAALVIADALKDETEENAPKVEGFYADILGAAISEVNWYEIAMSWVDDIADDIADDIDAEEKADEEADAE